jgi:hypothetical protein
LTWLDDLTLSSVIVHTTNGGPSYRAVRVAVYDDGILLRDVVNLDEDAQVVEAGTSFIPRQEVHRIQILEG